MKLEAKNTLIRNAAYKEAYREHQLLQMRQNN
jgi:hypothetical protein